MHYRRFFYCQPYRPLNPAQRILARRAMLCLLGILIAGLMRESLMAPLPALSVPGTAECVKQGYDLAICVDVARSHGDWRH